MASRRRLRVREVAGPGTTAPVRRFVHALRSGLLVSLLVLVVLVVVVIIVDVLILPLIVMARELAVQLRAQRTRRDAAKRADLQRSG
jgi:hypothetical protein